MRINLAKGDKVIVKDLGNRIGIIDGEPKEHKDMYFYPVIIDLSQDSSYYPEDSLERYLAPRTVEQLLHANSFSNTEDFIQALIFKKLEKPLSDNLYTFYASRTQFQVHQFKPVLKFLNSPKQKLLLADEVGLGKTIEAGIIITELSARIGQLSRVLVVCPSMLCPKWEQEMKMRFGMNFSIMNRTNFMNFLRRYDTYGLAEQVKGIISLQTLRAASMIERLREVAPHIDISIVDEAHYMRNPETLSSELGEVLSDLSDSMLFLSATPLHLGSQDLFNLLRLLVPEEFSDFALFYNLIEPNEYINDTLRKLHDPNLAIQSLKKVEYTSQKHRFLKNPFYLEATKLLTNRKKLSIEQGIRVQKLLTELNSLSCVFTRSKKRDVETHFPIREAHVIPVKFTDSEMEFYDAITDFISDRFAARDGSLQGISFAVIMPQRQVSSCIQAMIQNLNNIIRKKLVSAPSPDNGDIIDLAAEGSRWSLTTSEIKQMSKLQAIASKVGSTDTKFDTFLEALRKLEAENPETKILVFAFFKNTLEYLRRRLESTEYRGKVGLIHGGIKKDRQKIIDTFRNTTKMKILLSSEVGGEGLDFEFCNVMFNYDLPWNPMRVEQRIGRLDRFGQRHDKILIYNFSMIGTIDDEILNKLYLRINLFERYIGDLEVILGDQITKLTRDIFNPSLTHAQKVKKIEKVAENIERTQKELEDFESQCQKFIGQDEYFNNEISRILETKRFITADEVQHFLQLFLKKKFPDTTLLPPKSGRTNVFVLKAMDEFRRFINRFSPQSENILEIQKKLSQDGGTLVTFKDTEACLDRSLEFITIHHPIIKAIKRYYDENMQDVYKTAQFRLEGEGKNTGMYLFLIYLIQKNAIKQDLKLIPILVNMDNNHVHIQENICDWFLSNVVRAAPVVEGDLSEDSHEKIEAALIEAEEYLKIIREEEEDELRRNNNALIDNRIESIRQATEIKINKAQEIIKKLEQQGKTASDPIVKLHMGRIRNLKDLRDNQINDLETRRHASVAFNLIAGGIVDITQPH